ncbi:uncharacterized protein [Choristoneura fumiferana]|uniref:uncharacterized protein n=1 Tax=Choristoneura fumiferana TaxID=7141 RepID=UPI003D15CDEA
MNRQVDIKALVSHIVRGDGLDKCRICMGDTTDGQVYLGDTVMMDGERPVTLAELLEVITGIEVEEDAALPQGLCRACAEDAIAATKFRQLSVSSQQHWEQAVATIVQIHDPQDPNVTLYVHYNGAHSLIREEPGKMATTDDAVDSLNLKLPKKTKVKRAYKKSALKCRCPDCGKDFPVAHSLNVHLKNTMKRACVLCGQVLERHKLADHLAKVHEKNFVECVICFKLFESEDGLQQHYGTHHNRLSFGCQICGRGYTNDRALRSHMYAHTLFHCVSCNQSFENRRCFKHHQKKCKTSAFESATSLYTCDYCGNVYDKKPSLRIHIIQKHLNVLPYVCDTCGKRTSTLAHLRSHEAVHTTQRKLYKCACGAEMRTELGYHLHQRIHTGEKPYECEECGDRFLSASRRLDHIKRRHRSTKDMPHGCEMCHARFVRPFELKKHYAAVHDSVVEVLPAKKRFRRRMITDEALCPNGVCASCTTNAIAAQEFRSLVTDSCNMWSYAVDQLSTIPSNEAANVKSLCAFLRPDDFTLQIAKDFSSSDKTTPLIRLKSKINKKNSDEKRPRVHRTGAPCKCTDCGKQFVSPYYLKIHFKNSGQKDSCITCGSILFRGKQMRDHLVKVHRETAFLCSHCPAIHTNEIDAEKHEKVAHKNGLTCCDCGRAFLRQTSFDTHSQMHAVRTCRACGIQFTNRACYREHRAKCEPDAKPRRDTVPRNRRSNIRDPATFTCDYCKKTYRSLPQLKNHILWIHMNVRPHQCSWCGKRFYTPARLAEHTVVHTRERNFGCDICGAKLVSKMAAVYHRRRHTGEKPYKCEDCGDCFISASRRSEHAKRKHGKGRRLPCTQCSSTFVRVHELKKHIEKMHSNLMIADVISLMEDA